MKKSNYFDTVKLDDSLIRETGFNPYYPLISSGLDDPLLVEGRKFINLASNNYLGLANDNRIRDACIEAIRKYGVSMCATPVASGYNMLFKETEERLSDFLGLERAIIFPSCYQANNGLFSAIATAEDIIVVDRCAHSSLIEGIMSVGCKVRPYRHNDLEHLEMILGKTTGANRVFVVTESVFSTEGSIAPMVKINELCNRYNAIPVVDDSHGIGVLGKSGRGILEHSGITDFNGIYTASLGKAIGITGGIVASKKSLIDYLRYYTPHLIYSTAIIPAALGGIIEALSIIEEEFITRSKIMWDYKEQISESLRLSGFQLTDSITPITSIRSGNSFQTLMMAKGFFQQNILVTPFIAPSVPEKEGRIRIIAGANLKPSSIKRFEKLVSILNPDPHEIFVDHESEVKERKKREKISQDI